jgi:hypothetical protein
METSDEADNCVFLVSSSCAEILMTGASAAVFLLFTIPTHPLSKP